MVLSYREVGRERGRNELGKEGIQKEGGGTEGRRREKEGFGYNNYFL